jgi:RNA polymerase sigma-70 factor (ECF subfamily)
MYNLDHVSDQDIIPFLLQDRNVFGVLVKRYANPLSRYIRRIGVVSKDDREDVLQNVFIKTYRNIHSFDTSLSFSTWIYRIAHNEAISFFRAKKVRPEGHLVEDGEDALAKLFDDTDFVELLDQNMQAKRVAAHIEKLDQVYQDVIILRYFEDRGYTEISDILKIREGTVATLLHRAKKKLKILIENDQKKYE